MSLPPITIPDLDTAGIVDPNNDLMLIRQGLTDKKISVGNVNQPRFATFPSFPSPLQTTDVFLIGRLVSGSYVNYQVQAKDITFMNGTKMWFNQATPPSGWTLDNTLGDCLLAVKSTTGTGIYGTTGLQGTWLQEDHTLTIAEMPKHNHNILLNKASSTNGLVAGYGQAGTFIINNNAIQPTGGNLGHNHGSSWRPSAAVGCLGTKNYMAP